MSNQASTSHSDIRRKHIGRNNWTRNPPFWFMSFLAWMNLAIRALTSREYEWEIKYAWNTRRVMVNDIALYTTQLKRIIWVLCMAILWQLQPAIGICAASQSIWRLTCVWTFALKHPKISMLNFLSTKESKTTSVLKELVNLLRARFKGVIYGFVDFVQLIQFYPTISYTLYEKWWSTKQSPWAYSSELMIILSLSDCNRLSLKNLKPWCFHNWVC